MFKWPPYLPPPSVATPLPYFISEQLFVRDLEHVCSIPLHVVTVRPPSDDAGHHGNTEGMPTLGVASSGLGDRKRKWVESSNTATGVKNRRMSSSVKDEEQPLAGSVVSGCGHKQEQAACSHSMAEPHGLVASGNKVSEEDFDLERVLALSSAWVLDFDLDFFSTGNPFSEAFSTVGHTHCLVSFPCAHNSLLVLGASLPLLSSPRRSNIAVSADSTSFQSQQVTVLRLV